MFNNFISRVFALVMRSDRAGCIDQIKQLGLEGHAVAMAEAGQPDDQTVVAYPIFLP